MYNHKNPADIGNALTADACTPTQLQAAIGNLIELNGVFNEIISRLETKLQSVLRPKQEDSVEKGEPIENWVPAAEQIRGFTFRLKDYIYLIEDITDRIEA
jgi:hypothetical protein